MEKRSIMKVFIAFTILVGLGYLPANAANIKTPNTKLPEVVVISTGGTIAEKTLPGGGSVPAVTGNELVNAVRGLSKIARVKVINFSNIDSSHMTPAIWLRLSKVVNRELSSPKVAGVVITHGTDTLAEGAFFLSLTVKSTKPVVFVGAMRNASDLSPDGPSNIYNAVLQAATPWAGKWGVTVTMNQYINSAWYVRKIQTTNVQSFNSGEKGYLGYITGGKIQKINDVIHHLYFPTPKKLPKVYLIEQYAGADGTLIRAAIANGAKGIVVEGVGAGNVDPPTFKAIKEAIKKGIVVIIATRVYNGSIEPIYGDVGGGLTLERNGAILAGDLTGPKARILLMLALPEMGNNIKALRKVF